MVDKKRRGHNEGSVYYVPERDRWVAEISMGPGKRKKFYCKSKQEALKKKNDALRQLEQGILATGPQQKLKDYLEDWIENVHGDGLRISTNENYKKLIKYIVVDLGEVWLQKLTLEQVRRFYTKKSKDGLSSKTINSIHGILHVALDNAVRWGMVSRNVCNLVDPPRIVSREVVPLSVEQARRLVKHVEGNRLEVLLAMAVVTGMRRGELLALRWSDIDFDRSRLLVLHSVDFIAKHGYVQGEPKTASGKRVISLPAFLIGMLKKHQRRQLEYRKTVDNWQMLDLVFPNFSGGYTHPNHMGD